MSDLHNNDSADDISDNDDRSEDSRSDDSEVDEDDYSDDDGDYSDEKESKVKVNHTSAVLVDNSDDDENCSSNYDEDEDVEEEEYDEDEMDVAPHVRGFNVAVEDEDNSSYASDGDDYDDNDGYSDDDDDAVPMSKIYMPTGTNANITMPTPTDCACKKRAKTVHFHLKSTDALYGPEVNIVAQQMNNTILQHRNNMGGVFSRYNIIQVNKVKNCCLWKKYVNRKADLVKEVDDVNERLLFHGSAKHEEIVASGFDERHSSPRGYFGAGIYFAAHSSKSNQYVLGVMGGNGCSKHNDRSCYICERKMLLCRVLMGTISKQAKPEKLSHAPPGYNSVEGLPSPGFLQYPEYVIYRGDQAYPEYEIIYKIVR